MKLTDAARLAQKFTLAEPDELDQDALEIAVLRSPTLLSPREQLVVPLLQLRLRFDVSSVRGERLRFEDQAAARPERVKAPPEEDEEPRIESLQVYPLGDRQPARSGTRDLSGGFLQEPAEEIAPRTQR